MENKNEEAVWKEKEKTAEVSNMENNKQVVEYNITDAVIAKMSKIYMNLTITDLNDKEQCDAVRSARMVVKGHRVAVEKRRKELKADALAWGRKVDGRAKEIFGQLYPIENHLIAEEQKKINEEKRIKAEKEEALRVITQNRVEQLQAVGLSIGFDEAGSYTTNQFSGLLETETLRFKAEKKRLAQEEADRKAEDKRLAGIREEQEAEAAVLATQKKRILLAQKKIDDEKAELEADKKAEADRIKAEKQAAEKAEVEKFLADEKAEADAKRKEQEAIDQKAADEKEKKRQEALRPDKEKLKVFARELFDITGPELSDPELQEFLADCVKTVHGVGEFIEGYTAS